MVAWPGVGGKEEWEREAGKGEEEGGTLFLNCSKLLMNNLDDGIEISYNSTGVLAHLCSDGEAEWRMYVNEENVTEEDDFCMWDSVQRVRLLFSILSRSSRHVTLPFHHFHYDPPSLS